MKKNKLEIFLLGLILVLALALRVYKLDRIPPSLNWDEVAASYNAYSISHYGRDEMDRYFPLVFRSFLDDKHPVHIYFTALVVAIFGLSDFSARISAAFAGVGAVLAIFLLGRIWFGTRVGLLSAFFLAVSSYNIHFSRGLWETNFALLFYILGLYLFYGGLKEKSLSIIWSSFSFGVSTLSYHSSKIVVPATFVLLLGLYAKELLRSRWKFVAALVIAALFAGIYIKEPSLLGFARASQNKFSGELIQLTPLYKTFGDQSLGWVNVVFDNYLKHYSWDYLVVHGDLSPRNGTREFGQFYLWEVILAVVGLVVVLFRRSRISIVIVAWLLLSPIPSSMSAGAPAATRALFMMGVMQLLAAVGVDKAMGLSRKKLWVVAIAVLMIGLWLYSLSAYLKYYYSKYAISSAIDFQYGMKQIVEFVGENPQYNLVFMTAERSQPYIFFLNYLKYPLPDFVRSAEYNEGRSRSYNLINSFDKYGFGNWDIVGSEPRPDWLYILTPSEYDGLRRKGDFDVVKLIKYPDGSDAYFLVSGKN